MGVRTPPKTAISLKNRVPKAFRDKKMTKTWKLPIKNAKIVKNMLKWLQMAGFVKNPKTRLVWAYFQRISKKRLSTRLSHELYTGIEGFLGVWKSDKKLKKSTFWKNPKSNGRFREKWVISWKMWQKYVIRRPKTEKTWNPGGIEGKKRLLTTSRKTSQKLPPKNMKNTALLKGVIKNYPKMTKTKAPIFLKNPKKPEIQW